MGTGAERIPAGHGGAGEGGVIADLQEALRSDGLSLFYQPIVSLDTDSVLAVEGLLRWEHPEAGLLLAARILPLAERGGVLAELDRWVLDRACRQAASWMERRGEASAPRISVNVSADRLADPTLVHEITETMTRWSLRPGQLLIELRETPVLLTMPAAARLAELRALGVRVLLDDFGTGQASVFAMRRMFIDGFKLDRAFVELSAPAGRGGVVLDAMQRYAEGMGLDLIVTGVETANQLAELRALGIRAAQGLALLGPVPATTLMDVFDISRPRLGAVGGALGEAGGQRAGGEQTVTLSRAASMLDISPSTLRRWADEGRVAAVRTEGGHRRFRPSELRRVAGPRVAQVRTPTMPTGPLPAVAQVLSAAGVELAVEAGRTVYEDRPGWFASDAAHGPLREWTHGLTMSFAGGGYGEMPRHVAALMQSAERAGTTLAERHAFLEGFGAVLARRLEEAGGVSVDERAEARRALAALAQGLLEA